jgi:glycosyltransferase involved in cell wall biosynthesis
MTDCLAKATDELGETPGAAGAGLVPLIQIGLATFQSEPFLSDLIASLEAQTEQRFTLLAADDGSRDATVPMLEDYASESGDRVLIIARDRQHSGPRGNFARILEAASADYLMLCDHDDVWLPDKVARSLARMLELEKEHGSGTPLLVHTDLVVADAELRTIRPSLFGFVGGGQPRTDVVSLLIVNVVTGCTTLANRALYERARPIPAEAVMHDHWLALVAAATGVIGTIDEPTILYRQHGGNFIGAPKGGTAPLFSRVSQTLFTDNRQRLLRRYCRQAAALLQRVGDEMAPDARRATEALANIWSESRWRRFGKLRRCGRGFQGFIRNAALFMVLMRGRPDEPDEW